MVPPHTCSQCWFWLSKATGNAGTCRHYPPTPMPPLTSINRDQCRPEHYFPVTLHNQWCGEFKLQGDPHGA